MRVPTVDPRHERLIRELEMKLAYFRRISPRRREAECADEGESTCLALLAELRAGVGRHSFDGTVVPEPTSRLMGNGSLET